LFRPRPASFSGLGVDTVSVSISCTDAGALSRTRLLAWNKVFSVEMFARVEFVFHCA